MTVDMMPLIITEMASSKEPVGAVAVKDGINDEITYGAKGASIAPPAMAQAMKSIIDHSWRTILALRVWEKSAPLKPIESEIEPKAIIKKKASMKPMIINRNEGR